MHVEKLGDELARFSYCALAVSNYLLGLLELLGGRRGGLVGGHLGRESLGVSVTARLQLLLCRLDLPLFLQLTRLYEVVDSLVLGLVGHEVPE